MDSKFEQLVGKTFTEIDGCAAGSERIVFKCGNGESFVQYHSHDCCERVQVEDACGNISDLIGTPILTAEESSNRNETPEGIKPPHCPDSYTWTFYRLATVKGSVTIRWLGESNGYYGEEAAFEQLTPATKPSSL